MSENLEFRHTQRTRGAHHGHQQPEEFIARNRAPRVQIEYDVELYGAEKKVQLPFVMGVLADLSGKPAEPLPPVADRKFLEIDVDNFDARMKAMKPRVAFQVPEHADRRGQHARSTSPSRAWTTSRPPRWRARSSALDKLLEARQQLSNLVTYMDGKTGAEELIAKVHGRPGAAEVAGRSAKPEPAEGQ